MVLIQRFLRSLSGNGTGRQRAQTGTDRSRLFNEISIWIFKIKKIFSFKLFYFFKETWIIVNSFVWFSWIIGFSNSKLYIFTQLDEIYRLVYKFRCFEEKNYLLYFYLWIIAKIFEICILLQNINIYTPIDRYRRAELKYIIFELIWTLILI